MAFKLVMAADLCIAYTYADARFYYLDPLILKKIIWLDQLVFIPDVRFSQRNKNAGGGGGEVVGGGGGRGGGGITGAYCPNP